MEHGDPILADDPLHIYFESWSSSVLRKSFSLEMDHYENNSLQKS